MYGISVWSQVQWYNRKRMTGITTGMVSVFVGRLTGNGLRINGKTLEEWQVGNVNLHGMCAVRSTIDKYGRETTKLTYGTDYKMVINNTLEMVKD